MCCRTDEIFSTSSDHIKYLGDAMIQETQYLGDLSRHFRLTLDRSETRTSNLAPLELDHDGHHGDGVVVVAPEHHPEHQRPR